MDEPNPPIPFQHIESNKLDPQDRFPVWQDVLTSVSKPSLPDEAGLGGFNFEASIWHLGSIVLANGWASAQRQERDASKIRADQLDHYRIMLATGGLLDLDANGERMRLKRGDLVVVDMAQPSTIELAPGSGNLILYMPRELLDDAMPMPRGLHGLRPVGATAALLRSHLLAMVEQLPHVRRAEVPSLVQSTVHMVAAGLTPSAQNLDRARPMVEATLMRQIYRYIELHLGDESLSVEQICTTFKFSRASLYRLFEPLGGVARYIKERRLMRIHEELSATGSQPIAMGKLAARYGFKNASNFSRAFRERFGYSPQDARYVPLNVLDDMRYADINAELQSGIWLRTLRG